MFEGGEMIFERDTTDAFGHKKLGGIGDLGSENIKELSPKYNTGKTIDTINQKLGYLVRCGDLTQSTRLFRWRMAISRSI
jgi:6-phosphofructokinase 1